MKIVFPIITASSGSDIYYELLSSYLQSNGVTAQIIKLDYHYEFIPFLYRKIINKLKSFDIIHSNGEYGNLFKIPGKPLIITLHHNVFDRDYQSCTSLPQKLYHYGILKKRLRKSIEMSDAVVCVSKATKKSFLKTFPDNSEKIITIYNGIDINFFKPKLENVDQQQKTLLFVGKLSKRKGADLLAPIMCRLGEEFTLICVSKSQKVQGYPPNIRFQTNITQKELVERYSKAQILLFPSRLEGFGLAIAEAMACGLPVVASNCSAIPELIDNGKGGFLCPVGDVNAFAEKINLLADSPKLRREMGEYNRSKVEKMFTIDRMVNEYRELFEEALS